MCHAIWLADKPWILTKGHADTDISLTFFLFWSLSEYILFIYWPVFRLTDMHTSWCSFSFIPAYSILCMYLFYSSLVLTVSQDTHTFPNQSSNHLGQPFLLILAWIGLGSISLINHVFFYFIFSSVIALDKQPAGQSNCLLTSLSLSLPAVPLLLL